MVGEQPLRPQRHLILDNDDTTLPLVSYASPGSSSIATSHVVSHTVAGLSTFSLVTSTNLALANHLVSPNAFIILYR